MLDAIELYVPKPIAVPECALMAGISDSEEMPKAGGRVGICLPCQRHPSPIPDSKFQPSSDHDTQRFVEILRDAGISATIRLRRGIEINAGCGQLRRTVQKAA